MTSTARNMLALMALYEQSPDPKLAALIERIFQSFPDMATVEGDLAWHHDPEVRLSNSKLGVLAYGWNVFIQGTELRLLGRYMDWRPEATNVAYGEKIQNYVMQPKFWEPEAYPKVIVTSDRGWFTGHFHSYTSALMGLLRRAEATGDRKTMEFVRASYEYVRNFGIARIGLFGEMCATGDMVYLAIKLSDLGVGDYWDDADGYLRNQIAEMQITDADKIEAASKAEPVLARHRRDQNDQVLAGAEGDDYPWDPIKDTEDNVIERNIGAYLSDAGDPTHIPKHRFLYTICCTGNCIPALYFAWEGIVRHEDGDAQVNLLLNRASPWLDLDSHLPYEGKVVVRNKQARRLSVRMPGWVELDSVRVTRGGAQHKPLFAGRYLVIDPVAAGEEIVIEFPMAETVETYKFKWSPEEFWMESTNPGTNWQPPEELAEYTFHMRGNTLVDVEPEYTGDLYKLYERDEMKSGKAPMRAVKRFVTPVRIDW